jgi:uncharacterized membrane protein
MQSSARTGCAEVSRALRIIRGRPRLFSAALIGIVVGLAMPPSVGPLTRAITAWDAACVAFLALSAHLFSSQRRGGIAADAERQEEGEWSVFWFTVGAVTASFAAIIGEFSMSKDMPPAPRALHVGLVASTLLLSWLTTQTVFALRYAHEYYEDAGDGTLARGLVFPGEDTPDYWDFFYFALVLGMTFQVSDVQITRRSLRRVAAAHGLLGFLFNTVILALSVNIAAGFL